MRYVVKKYHLLLQYFSPKRPQIAGTFQKILRRSISTDPPHPHPPTPPPSEKKSEISQYKKVTSFLTDYIHSNSGRDKGSNNELNAWQI